MHERRGYRRAVERGVWVLGACLIGGACSAESEPAAESATATDGNTTDIIEPEPSSGGEASTGDEEVPDTRRCIPPADVSGDPRTIDEAVLLLNALPAPVDIPCFLESLERPLKIYASTSTFSAQPAFNAENPRVFILAGDLVMSVVSAGEGVKLLEFGEFIDDFQTIKGEVELPLEGQLAPADPYSRIRFGSGTGCGQCHRNEHEVGTLDGETLFASLAYQPAVHHELPEDEVRAAYEACEGDDTERCRILTALFGHGPVLFTVFPEDLPTFGD